MGREKKLQSSFQRHEYTPEIWKKKPKRRYSEVRGPDVEAHNRARSEYDRILAAVDIQRAYRRHKNPGPATAFRRVVRNAFQTERERKRQDALDTQRSGERIRDSFGRMGRRLKAKHNSSVLGSMRTVRDREIDISRMFDGGDKGFSNDERRDQAKILYDDMINGLSENRKKRAQLKQMRTGRNKPDDTFVPRKKRANDGQSDRHINREVEDFIRGELAIEDAQSKFKRLGRKARVRELVGGADQFRLMKNKRDYEDHVAAEEAAARLPVLPGRPKARRKGHVRTPAVTPRARVPTPPPTIIRRPDGASYVAGFNPMFTPPPGRTHRASASRSAVRSGRRSHQRSIESYVGYQGNYARDVGGRSVPGRHFGPEMDWKSSRKHTRKFNAGHVKDRMGVLHSDNQKTGGQVWMDQRDHDDLYRSYFNTAKFGAQIADGYVRGNQSYQRWDAMYGSNGMTPAVVLAAGGAGANWGITPQGQGIPQGAGVPHWDPKGNHRGY